MGDRMAAMPASLVKKSNLFGIYQIKFLN